MLTVCIISSRCAIISSLLEGPDPQPALPTPGPERALLWGRRRRRRGKWQRWALPHGRLPRHPVLQHLQSGRAASTAAWPGQPPGYPLPQQRRRARRKDPVCTSGRGGAAGSTSEGGAERARCRGLQLPQPERGRPGHPALWGSGLSLLLHVLLWDIPVTWRGWRHTLQGLWEHRVPGGGRWQWAGVPTQLWPTQKGLWCRFLWSGIPGWGGWRGGGQGRRAKQPMTPLFSSQCLIPPGSFEGFPFSNNFPSPPWRLKNYDLCACGFFFLFWLKCKSSVFALLAAFQLPLSTL